MFQARSEEAGATFAELNNSRAAGRGKAGEPLPVVIALGK